jgi:hypothetical protein
MRRIGFVFLTLASVLATAALGIPARIALAQSVKINGLEDFEHRLEAKLAQTPPPRPFEVLFPAPAIYVSGVGVMLSSIVNLAYIEQPSPFRGPYTPKELAGFRDAKLRHVPILEQGMREVMVETAAAADMDAVPANERIVLGVTLFYFKWEDSSGLPRQIVMSAEKQKLLQARRDKLDLAAVIQEQKL